MRVGEEGGQRTSARSTRMGVEDALDVPEVEELELLCPLNGAPEVMRRDDGRQVEERPRNGCDRDAVPGGDLPAGEPPRLPHSHASRVPPCPDAVRHRDVDVPAPRPEAPECCGASMAQDRSLPARERGGHPLRLRTERTVAHRVDAGVQLHESARTQAGLDAFVAEAGGEQVAARHHAVLALRDPPKHVMWMPYGFHMNP
jgi:hypothetical protein